MFATHVCFCLAPRPDAGRMPSRDLFSDDLRPAVDMRLRAHGFAKCGEFGLALRFVEPGERTHGVVELTQGVVPRQHRTKGGYVIMIGGDRRQMRIRERLGKPAIVAAIAAP